MMQRDFGRNGRLTVCPLCDANLDIYSTTTDKGNGLEEVACQCCGFVKSYPKQREEK